MRLILVAGAALALGITACSPSPQQVAETARREQAAADRAVAEGRYGDAAAHQRAANEQMAEAYRRAGDRPLSSSSSYTMP